MIEERPDVSVDLIVSMRISIVNYGAQDSMRRSLPPTEADDEHRPRRLGRAHEGGRVQVNVMLTDSCVRLQKGLPTDATRCDARRLRPAPTRC